MRVDRWQDWRDRAGVNRGQTDILKPSPRPFPSPGLERPLPGKLVRSLLSQDTPTACPGSQPFQIILQCRHPAQNIPPQWPRRCSSQKPLQSRLPLSQQPHGQGPLLPRDPASQARNPPQCIFSAGSPVPHHRSGASWGLRCSGRVPALVTAGSSSQRQEKLVPWSSLLGCTVNMTSAGSPFPTGCRASSSSPRSSTTERRARGGPARHQAAQVEFFTHRLPEGQGSQLHMLREPCRGKGCYVNRTGWLPAHSGCGGALDTPVPQTSPFYPQNTPQTT